MIARIDRLETAIAELIGNNRAMVLEFKKVVKQIHREKEQEVVQRNCALREILGHFGYSGATKGNLTWRIRQGGDVDKEVRFDQIAEYAEKNYPHLLSTKRGESDTGSAEEAMTRWIQEGIQSVPNAFDQEILELAMTQVGPDFFDYYKTGAAPAASTESAMEKAIVRLEAYYAKIKQSIEDENNGAPAIGWPKYRLSRLRNEINKLPEEAREEAQRRARLDECEQMVKDHFACSAF